MKLPLVLQEFRFSSFASSTGRHCLAQEQWCLLVRLQSPQVT